MRRSFKFLIIAVLASMISACSTTQVLSDHDEKRDFSKYHSFKILSGQSEFPAEAKPANRARLELEIQQNLEALDYQMAEAPDLLVTYFVSKETKFSQTTDHLMYDEWDYIDPFESFSYKEGSLIINLIDAKEKVLVWRGVLTRAVNEDPATVHRRMHRNVDRVFERFEKETRKGR